jgi:alkylhydroperoxidase family enzyme
MAWIKVVAEEEADGLLEKIYSAARQRAGKIFNILKVQSLNPRSLRAGTMLYQETTLADSPLSRALREMIATVVSKANACHY